MTTTLTRAEIRAKLKALKDEHEADLVRRLDEFNKKYGTAYVKDTYDVWVYDPTEDEAIP